MGFADVGGYDDDIYTGSKSKFEGYHTSLAIDEADVSKANKTKAFIVTGCSTGSLLQVTD